MQKSADAYRTISEAADELKLPQHVLRFWETRFPQIQPLKRGGNRRFYRPDDVELLGAIKTLLYSDGFTIKGVQRLLKERGPRTVTSLALARGADGKRRPMFPSPEDAGEAASLGDAGSGAADGMEEDQAAPLDLLDCLQSVLFELSECRRILSAVRD